MLLEVEDLYAGYYPEVNIINGISMSVDKGQIVGIIGPNGCGKSTLLYTIFGFLKPRKGAILFDGKDLAGIRPHQLTKLGMILFPQTGGNFQDFTVIDNLKMSMWTHRKDKKMLNASIEMILDRFPVLKEKKNSKANTLSGGMQKMLEFSRIYLFDSKLVLLDEPTAGLSPKATKETMSLVEGFRKQGISIVLVDHNIRMVVDVADYVYHIGPGGKLISEGPKEIFQGELSGIVKKWI
jgi:branched-chain amino acid transport system ATP-binding protein